MTKQYKKLAIHNSVCNDIYFKFQDCLQDHPYAKYIGECTTWGKQLENCIKANRERMREQNHQLALEKLEKIKGARGKQEATL